MKSSFDSSGSGDGGDNDDGCSGRLNGGRRLSVGDGVHGSDG